MICTSVSYWVLKTVVCINFIGVNHPAIVRAIRLSSRIFCENVQHFRDDFQRHVDEDILWTEDMRKHPRRAPAMFSPPGDQNVNGNLIAKAPHSAVWRKNASIFLRIHACQSTSAKTKIERPAFFLVHVDTHVIYIIIFNYSSTCHERTPSGPGKCVRTLQVAARHRDGRAGWGRQI